MDYYKILGVDKNSSPTEIKKAYHKLAHQHHPDKGGDEKKFKEINEAYQILSNPEKKKQYDTFGSAGPGFGAGGPFGGGNPFGGAQGNPFGGGGWNVNFNGGNTEDIQDIFDMFFGGGRGGRRKTYRRGNDLEMIVQITLEEAKSGKTVENTFNTFVECDKCNGVGHNADAGFDTCSHCNGKGETREERSTFFGKFAQVVACKKCGGAGKIPKDICKKCSGEGRVRADKKIKFEIRPGIEDGQIIKIPGMGEAGEHNQPSGDLYVRVRVKPHKDFKRVGNDIYTSVPVKITDALLGSKQKVENLGGEEVEFSIPSGFDLRDEIKVKGKGMTSSGDLIIKPEIQTPKKLNSKAKKLIEELEGEL